MSQTLWISDKDFVIPNAALPVKGLCCFSHYDYDLGPYPVSSYAFDIWAVEASLNASPKTCLPAYQSCVPVTAATVAPPVVEAPTIIKPGCSHCTCWPYTSVTLYITNGQAVFLTEIQQSPLYKLARHPGLGLKLRLTC